MVASNALRRPQLLKKLKSSKCNSPLFQWFAKSHPGVVLTLVHLRSSIFDPRYRSSPLPQGLHIAFSTLFRIPMSSPSSSLPSPDSRTPRTVPINPPGFGTGHSLLTASLSSRSAWRRLSSLKTSLQVSDSGSDGVRCRRRRRRIWPVGSAESVRVRGSTGQGIRCGAATTRKETMRVVVKSEVVMRERGWRCGGMVVCVLYVVGCGGWLGKLHRHHVACRGVWAREGGWLESRRE